MTMCQLEAEGFSFSHIKGDTWHYVKDAAPDLSAALTNRISSDMAISILLFQIYVVAKIAAEPAQFEHTS
jgi:hypothetical protein